MGWYDVSWIYRKAHTITLQDGAGTDYPVYIIAHYGSGADYNDNEADPKEGHIYLGSKSRTDFGDIRFTSSDGETLLDFWQYKKTDSSIAYFWVKVSENLTNSNRVIYIYYGNLSATRADNPHEAEVFQIREFKHSSSFNPDIAFSTGDDDPPTHVLINSNSASIGMGFFWLIIKRSYLDGKKLKIRWNGYWSYSDTKTNIFFAISDDEGDRFDDSGDFGNEGENNRPTTFGGNGGAVSYTELLSYTCVGSGWGGWRENTSAVIDVSSWTSDYINILVWLQDGWNSQTVQTKIDWIKILDSDDSELATIDIKSSDYPLAMEREATTKDAGLYRKNIATEPDHGAWGSEETVEFALTINSTPVTGIVFDLEDVT